MKDSILFALLLCVVAFALSVVSANEKANQDIGFQSSLWCVSRGETILWDGEGNRYTPYIFFAPNSCFRGDLVTFNPTTQTSKFGYYSASNTGVDIFYGGNGHYGGLGGFYSTSRANEYYFFTFTCSPIDKSTAKKLVTTCTQSGNQCTITRNGTAF